MTRQQAKIEALRHIVAIADVTFDEEFYSGATELSEKEAEKIRKELDLLLDKLRDRLQRMSSIN